MFPAFAALPLLVALAQPNPAPAVGYDCTLRDAAAGWPGPQRVRVEIDPAANRAVIAELDAPARTWTFADRPAEDYRFKVSVDEFGTYLGTGFVPGSGTFLDSLSIEVQTGRMMWMDLRLEIVPAATFWACTAID